jgi:SAM-dependent methyltransferase
MENLERWSGVENRKAYDAMAPFYERHLGTRFLASAKELFSESLRQKVAAGASVLDLCCGTGEFAAWLGAQGMRVTGLDNSARMLRCAQSKVPDADFCWADMRAFNLPYRFDVVTCFYNSINQALTMRSLGEVLRSVRRHVREGGWFLFDAIDEQGYIESWETDEVVQVNDRVCELRYRYDHLRNLALCRVSIDGIGREMKCEFELRQRPFLLTDLENELEKAEFAVESIRPVGNAKPIRGRYAVLASALRGTYGTPKLTGHQIVAANRIEEPALAICGGHRAALEPVAIRRVR